jgi:RHS repeat-associated protein
MRQGYRWFGILVVVLLVPIWGTVAWGAPADPAPIPREAAEHVLTRLKGRGSSPLAAALGRHLDQAQTLLAEIEREDHADGPPARPATARQLLAGKRHELDTLRIAIRDHLRDIKTRASSRGAHEYAVAMDDLLAKVEDRFERIGTALAAVHQSPTKAGRQGATVQARSLLRALHGQVKESQAPGEAIPEPTFRQPAIGAPDPILLETSRGRARRTPWQIGNDLYAFSGGTLLAALAPPPATPPASPCNWTATSDLGSSPEIPITYPAPTEQQLNTEAFKDEKELRELAASLGYSPARIYEYVHNTIAYEPYWGSLKGAMGTLRSQAGNATDQASLLIALLRASNIPARYIRGTVKIFDERVQRWVGAKSYKAAAAILFSGMIPNTSWLYTDQNHPDTTQIGMQFEHVWAEACVPYGNYRGSRADESSARWLPLDASFKDKAYQAGIALPGPGAFDFDYSTYLAARTDELPYEKYLDQVEQQVKGTSFTNTAQDVGYVGTIIPQRVNPLPASLPYTVTQYATWTGGQAWTATVPEEHRYQLSAEVRDILPDNSETTILTWTLSYPQTTLQRITLSYMPSVFQQALWDAWNGDLQGALPSIVIYPVLKVDGTAVQQGGATLLGRRNKLILKLTLGEFQPSTAQCADDTDLTCVNKATYPRLVAGAYHALQAYAFQASDALLVQRTDRLLQAVRAAPQTETPPPYTDDETLGEFLHLALLKYLRHISETGRTIGELNGVVARPGNHIGATSSSLYVQYLFDIPFAIFPKALLIDVRGGVFATADLTTGDPDWRTFKLIAYNGSAFEHYIWQEVARLDAVSTVRGWQFARESSIPIVTYTDVNISCYDINNPPTCSGPLMDGGMAGHKGAITALVAAGYTVQVPRQQIVYGPTGQAWTGAVYMAEHQAGQHKISAAIDGHFGGGYALIDATPAMEVWSYNIQGSPGSSIDPGITAEVLNYIQGTGIYQSSLAGANGVNANTVNSGDPVNMVTGNMYHTERDLVLRGRGGLPIVFERSYNSRNPQTGPLGYGWTHSFNHYLKHNGLEEGYILVSWVDGTGGEKFFRIAGAGPVPPCTGAFENPSGVYVDFRRNPAATCQYTIREKNGLTYAFEDTLSTSGARAKLLSITDRKGNALTLSYTGNQLTTVTDGAGRALTFTSANNRITQVRDWTNRTHEYLYDTAGDLVTYRNPLALAGAQPPVSYTYATAPAHAMETYTLPRGNGMKFEYYMNGRVFRHTQVRGSTTGGTMTFTYNEFRRETVQVNERGQTRRFIFNEHGNPLRIVEESGGAREYTYGATAATAMNRLSTQDPMGYQTRYCYDAVGNVTRIIPPAASTVTCETASPAGVVEYWYPDPAFFNSFNQPWKIKDARGDYTLQKFSTTGNLLQVIRLRAGVGADITDPQNYTPLAADVVAWTINTYDAYGNLQTARRVRDFAAGTGPTVEFAYDAQGLTVQTVTRKRSDGSVDATAGLQSDTLGRPTLGLRADWYTTQTAYDAVDRMVRGTDAVGQLRDRTYDPNGNLAGESLTVGGVLHDATSFTYDDWDRRVSTTNAGGYTTRYAYDPVGNLTQVTNPDGYTLTYAYDPTNHVLAAADEEGNAVTRTLDLNGRPRTVTDPNGTTVEFTYYGQEAVGGNGRLKERREPRADVTDPTARRVTTYEYDPHGNVTRVVDTAGNATETWYDELDRPIRVVRPGYLEGGTTVHPVTCYTYDTLGNLATGRAGRAGSGATCATDTALVSISQATYDDFGRKLTETDALGRTWGYAYTMDVTQNRRTVAMTDPKGQVIAATYGYGDQLLNRTATGSLLQGGGATVALTQAAKTWPDGYSPLYRGGIHVRDAAAQLLGGDVRREHGLGPQVGHLYTGTTPPAGAVPVYPAPVCTAVGGSCTWSLGTATDGSVVGYLAAPTTTPAPGVGLTQSGGLLLAGLTGTPTGYLWSSPTGASRTDHLYTTTGAVPAGYTEEGTLGYLRTAEIPGSTDPLKRFVNAATGSHYYTTSTAPQDYVEETTLGHLDRTAGTGVWFPLARHANSTTGDYLLTTSTTPPAGYTYQATLGYLRPTGDLPPGDPQLQTTVVTYLRNPLGQVLQVETPDVVSTYTYDQAHRLRTVTDSRGGKTLTSAYTAGGRIAWLQDTEGQRTDYQYDPVGRLQAVWAPGGQTLTFAYDAGGRLTAKTYPTGAWTEYLWNKDNSLRQLTNYTGSESARLSQHTYTYDARGRRTRLIEEISGQVSYTYNYTYDDLGRLTAANRSGRNETYTYDEVDNRTSLIRGTTTWTYTYNATRTQLTSFTCSGSQCGGVTAKSFTYDRNGNLATTTAGTATTMYTSDPLNRLTWVQPPTGSGVGFTYDDQGRRLSRTQGASTTHFLHAGSAILAEYDTTWNTPTAQYTHGPGIDHPLLVTTPTTTQYYHQDGLGSVAAMTNETGATTARSRYDAWGNVVASTGTLPRYGYTGREPDPDTGLVYYRARYYDPTLGRFTQRDPIGLAGGLNQYAYVGGNPISFTDPYGQYAWIDDLVFTAGGAIIGVGAQVGVDLLRGTLPSARDLWGAGIGGAAGGWAALYTGPVGAGAAGGAFSAVAKNTYDLAQGVFGDRDLLERMCDALLDVGSGVVGGKIPGLLNIPGVTTGSNSYAAIAKQLITKFKNGTIEALELATAIKMAVGKLLQDGALEASAETAVAGVVWETLKQDAKGPGAPSAQTLPAFTNPAASSGNLGQAATGGAAPPPDTGTKPH